MSNSYRIVKRVLDVVGALICLILFSPVILITALAVRANLGSPVLFKQERPGLNERIFTLYKFRSMKSIDESKGLNSDAERLGKFGRILRSTSLDELPSLWNVMRGDMSFVGPRPLLVEYLAIYSLSQRRRHNVKPGITGLAQTSGRNGLSWEKKFELDVLYAENLSFPTDLQILGKTISVVLTRQNISSPGTVTSSKFSLIEEENS
jgi:lipopolysaccharide/colanic/teichoic acid biosynthesis glycosyltransferase